MPPNPPVLPPTPFRIGNRQGVVGGLGTNDNLEELPPTPPSHSPDHWLALRIDDQKRKWPGPGKRGEYIGRAPPHPPSPTFGNAEQKDAGPQHLEFRAFGTRLEHAWMTFFLSSVYLTHRRLVESLNESPSRS